MAQLISHASACFLQLSGVNFFVSAAPRIPRWGAYGGVSNFRADKAPFCYYQIMPKVKSKDGTEIKYDKRGSGPVLVLVLGALNKRGSGKKLSQLLTDKFTVISYDRRGRGDSGDTQPYSVDKEVEDIDCLITELGGKAFLYGHSSGAILALMAADKLKAKVLGVAVYEVPYDDDKKALKSVEEYRKKLKQYLEKNKNVEAVTLFIKLFGVSDKQIQAMKRLPVWKGLIGMAHTLEYDTVELIKAYPKIKFNKIESPTLVMYGTASPIFMKNTAEKLNRAISKAKLLPLEKQTHDVKPNVLVPVLIKFLK